MKGGSIGITGHRPDKLGNDYTYTGPLVKHIENRIIKAFLWYEPEKVNIGMAIGTDFIAAHVCGSLKIPYTAYVPQKGQERKWRDVDQKFYHRLLVNASRIWVADCNMFMNYDQFAELRMRPFDRQWLFKRNERIVYDSKRMIAVYDGSPGGTGHAYNLAKNRVPILRINPRRYA